MWVIENPGSPANQNTTNLLVTTTLNVQVYPPPSDDSFGGRRIIALDQNGDGDLDLVIGSGKGASRESACAGRMSAFSRRPGSPSSRSPAFSPSAA